MTNALHAFCHISRVREYKVKHGDSMATVGPLLTRHDSLFDSFL